MLILFPWQNLAKEKDAILKIATFDPDKEFDISIM